MNAPISLKPSELETKSSIWAIDNALPWEPCGAIAILLTTGAAHDRPVAERLIRRVKPSKLMLGDKAYDSAELREDLHERGTKPVIPNRCNRKQPFSVSTSCAGASRARSTG
jgi:IS5 family transposase